jgi:ABC-type transporter Mla MlaB component
VIAFSNMGGTHAESPYSYYLQGQTEPAQAIVIDGDLRNIDRVRAFWQLTLEILEDEPSAVWLNLTKVLEADTKLAACLVAILRRAQEHETTVYIVGSNAVQEILKLCKVPPLKQFTKVA